jgi:putative ABC transport system ATP-binding protein
MCIVEARDVRKTYGAGETCVEAVRGVDLQVRKGEFLAIMGRSGSGKSTFLSILGGIETPTAGSVLLEGVDLASLRDEARTVMRRRRIGFVFQLFNLIPILTAWENVALPLELDGMPTGEARERAAAMLDVVNLAARRHHMPGMMSGGEQQRVAVARALVIRPAIVLADEPTGNLDSANGERLMGLFRRLVDEEQQTLIMVTHDSAVADQADRVIHLRDGQVVDGSEHAASDQGRESR